MSEDPAAPYEALAALIERELELVGQRDFTTLHELKPTRRVLERALPASPAPEARAALERCRLLHKRVEIELLRVREALLMELAQVRQAQRAATGYAPAMTRQSRLDTSA